MDFGAIFFETRTARIAYAPTLPPFGLQSGGRSFNAMSSILGTDLLTILCRVARNASGIIAGYIPFAPRFGLQNGVILKALSNFVRYGGKEAQSGGEEIIMIYLPNIVSPYEKKRIRSNAPFFITLLISSFQSTSFTSFRQRNHIISSVYFGGRIPVQKPL